MSNPYPGPTGGNMAEPVTQAEAQQIAGEQLAGQAAAAPAPDAGPSLEQMQQESREVLLPMEQQVENMMAEFRAAQDKQAAQIADLQNQLSAARQQAGPPAVEQYANGVAALLKAHQAANPDVPPGTFDDVRAAAAKMQQAATDAVTSRDPSELNGLAAQVTSWADRYRGKHLDLSSLRADLELLGEAAARLAV
jgi:hypothetical protein